MPTLADKDEALQFAEAGTREVPVWITREVKKAGGNRFRVIWGGNRLSVGTDGVMIHPYQQNRWHLEKLLNGEWEHCYVIAHCTHKNPLAKAWCNSCFKNGGEYLPIEAGWQYVVGLIHLIKKSEEMQNDALQKAALFEREQKKEDAGQANIDVMFRDAMPKTVKRSFDTPLRLTADQALGRRKGLRRMNARDIVRQIKDRAATN